jgi:hypothetical protein
VAEGVVPRSTQEEVEVVVQIPASGVAVVQLLASAVAEVLRVPAWVVAAVLRVPALVEAAVAVLSYSALKEVALLQNLST